MTLTVRPIGDGHFAIDDGSVVLSQCPHCLQHMGEGEARSVKALMEQRAITIDQMIVCCDEMERASDKAADDLMAIARERTPTMEEIHAITGPLRALKSRFRPDA